MANIIQDITAAIHQTIVSLRGKRNKLDLSNFLQPTLPLGYSLWEIQDTKITGCGNLSESVKQHNYTVPEGQREIIACGYIEPDVSGTANVRLYNNAGTMVSYLLEGSAGTARLNYPEEQNAAVHPMLFGIPYLMKQGDYLQFNFQNDQSNACEIFIRQYIIPANLEKD